MSNFGLVLNSDGRQGIYEVGIFRAFCDAEIFPACIIGRGTNAINAALLASGDLQKAESFHHSQCMEIIMDLNALMIKKYTQICTENAPNDFSALTPELLYGDIDLSRLKRLLPRYIDETALRESPVDFGLITADPKDLSPKALMLKDIPQGQLMDYLLISATLPVMISEDDMESPAYDNLFLEQAPLYLLHRAGITQAVLLTQPSVQTRRLIKRLGLVAKILLCSQYLDGNPDTHRSEFELGYIDGSRFIGRLSGHYFNIDFNGQNDFYDLLEETIKTPPGDDDFRKQLASLICLSDNYNEEEGYKNILMLLRKTSFGDQTPTLSMIEAAGKVLALSQTTFYTPDGLIEAIVSALEATISNQIETILQITDEALMERYDPEGEKHPLSLPHFLAVYAGIITRGKQFPKEITQNFSRSVSPDTVLAMIVLITIHDMLKRF